MKVGNCLPIETELMGGKTARGEDIVRLTRLTENMGFDSIWVVDHFCYELYKDQGEFGITLGEDMKGVKFGAWECWTVVAALAALTSRIEIGTLVSNTGFRNPALLARMADTVDELSAGRLVLGLGAGDLPSEHEAFGYPWERRVGRFEEALQIIRPMLRGEAVTFNGEFYTAHEARLIPKGPRADGPPIMIGLLKGGPRMKRLVAQYADQWNCWLASHDSRPQAYAEIRSPILAACEKHGRDPATLERNVTVRVRPTAGSHQYGGMTPIEGSVDEMADQLNAYRELDVDHLSVWLIPNDDRGMELFAPVLEQIER